ncbi:MAG: YhdH/YhfP family quinone oxidoreductase [Bdellovibrionales bacterium]|nr:YhdH/YhfP family quinone oxidoreductase [Bdellovibrionales bacterium]
MIPASFSCYRISSLGGKIQGRLESCQIDELSPGEVIIKAHYSSINYKDALAATGKGKILRKFPLIGGIDVSGEVIASEDHQFGIGQLVLVTGCGLGEVSDGGYSEYVRVPGAWVVPLSVGLTPKEAMILGTAGFTAGLCLSRLEANGQKPDMGPILVTGASGGVGVTAIQILSQVGYEVIAVSGKQEATDLLKSLGAKEVISPSELKLGNRPLETARWAGAIDNVGGSLLSRLLGHINLWGNIASVGMAEDFQLNTTVFPMILRGVSLLGISSTNCPAKLRLELWKKLSADWKPKLLSLIHCQTIRLQDLEGGFEKILERRNIGRMIVSYRPE